MSGSSIRNLSSIDAGLSQAVAAFSAANPKSHAQYQKATASMPGGNTRSSLFYDPFPLTMTHGEGANLWDLDGHRYIDFLSEFTAGVYGHSHPKIIATLQGALKNGLSLSAHTRGEADLAVALCKRFPTFETLRFTNSGTEANIMALAAARAFTGREKIAFFKGCYHGGPLAFVGKPSRGNIPYDIVMAPYNDLERALDALNPNAANTAAVIVEPMLGAAGCIPGDPEFLRGLRQWCDRNGVLLIFDEVMTSRLHPHGLQAALGIQPDLTTMGKYLGGGMPIGVFGGRAEIMAQFDPRGATTVGHAGTFNNNTMTMAAGLVGVTEIFTEVESQRLSERGDAFRDRLNTICRAANAPLHFSGYGSVMNLHAQPALVTRPEQLAQDVPGLKDLIFFDLLDAGVFLAKRGLVALNLCLTDADLDQFAEAFQTILERREPYFAGLTNGA